MSIPPPPDHDPTRMPGITKAARVLIFVMAGLLVLSAVLLFATASVDIDEYCEMTSQPCYADDDERFVGRLLVGFGITCLVFAVPGVVLGTRFRSGGSGVRTAGIVWGGFGIVVGMTTLFLFWAVIPMAILVIVFLSLRRSSAWFIRPRY